MAGCLHWSREFRCGGGIDELNFEQATFEIPGSYLVGRQLSTSDNQNDRLQDIKISELTVFRGQMEPWTSRSRTHSQNAKRGLSGGWSTNI